MERKDLLKQRQELKNQLTVYECSIFLYELQQEASITRQKKPWSSFVGIPIYVSLTLGNIEELDRLASDTASLLILNKSNRSLHRRKLENLIFSIAQFIGLRIT